jgi:hypothetical protein
LVREESSHTGAIVISTVNADDATKYKLKNVSTSKGLNLKKISFNVNEMQKKFAHLRGLSLNNYENIQPKILIGLDNAKLTQESEFRCGLSMDEPVACKTIFGWAVKGPTIVNRERKVPTSNREESPTYIVRRVLSHTRVTNENDFEEYDNIHQIVKEGFAVDNLCVVPSTPLVGLEEKRAIEIMNQSIKIENNIISMRLLRKEDNIILPDNFKNAVRIIS